MTTLPLFPESKPDDALNVRAAGDSLFYDCPHCGREMSKDEGESLAQMRADPACCFCRAEFAGMAFQAWRKLPMTVKATHCPPAEWRSRTWRAA